MCLLQDFLNRFYFVNTGEDDDDDGSESIASSGTEGSEEGPNHHLLTTPAGDVAFLKEKPVRLAREH